MASTSQAVTSTSPTPATTGSRSSTPTATSCAPSVGASTTAPPRPRSAPPAARPASPAPAPGQFDAPRFVAVDNSGGPSDGDVYVGDTATDLIQKFDSDGQPDHRLGLRAASSTARPPPTAPSPPGRLAGIAVDSAGVLDAIVGDFPTDFDNRIFQFAPSGAFVTDFPTGDVTQRRGLAVDPPGTSSRSTDPRTSRSSTAPAPGSARSTAAFSTRTTATTPAP